MVDPQCRRRPLRQRRPDRRAGRLAQSAGHGRGASSRRRAGETKGGGKPGKKTAEALGTLAAYALYARDSHKALAAAARAHMLAPDVIWPDINRACALMLLGRGGEARTLFLGHRGESTLGDPWATVVAGTFGVLRDAGLAHPMMREVEATLGVTPQEQVRPARAGRPSEGARISSRKPRLVPDARNLVRRVGACHTRSQIGARLASGSPLSPSRMTGA